MSTDPVRVLVADDQRVVRDGLAMVLSLLPGIEVVGSASDGAEAVLLAGELHPDVVLMDLRMPRCDGVEATRRLRAELPDVRVLVLTTFSDDQSVLEALRAGARGYLTKDASGAEIRDALLRVAKDSAAIDPAVQHHLLEAIAGTAAAATGVRRPRTDTMTARESEVLALVAHGLSNAEIARELVVTEATVKSHINRLFAKIGARDRAQAVAYAYQTGVV